MQNKEHLSNNSNVRQLIARSVLATLAMTGIVETGLPDGTTPAQAVQSTAERINTQSETQISQHLSPTSFDLTGAPRGVSIGNPASPSESAAVESKSLAPSSNTHAYYPEVKPPNPKTPRLELHPETWTVPANVKKIMDKNTTYMSYSGCTGFMVRDSKGLSIGALTAEHCNLRGNKSNLPTRYLGSDGKYYIETYQPPIVSLGSDHDALKPAARITEYYVPKTNDLNLDTALAVFKGHTSKEVLDAYNHNKLSDKELAALKPGDRMYLSGWPVYQPRTKAPSKFERQNFALGIIGREKHALVNSGEQLDVVWAAVPASTDGAECSFGDSGGEGFIMQNGKPHAVGTLGIFVDLTGKVYGTRQQAIQSRHELEQKFNVDLNGIAAVCGFAYVSPSAKNGGMTVHPVNDRNDIPGFAEFHSEAGLLKQARAEFFDPNYKRSIIDGSVAIQIDTGTIETGATKGGPIFETKWIERPAVFYDPITGYTILASYDNEASDHLRLDFLYSLNDMSIYGAPDQPALGIWQVGGEVSTLNPDTNQPDGGFHATIMDNSPFEFGQIVPGVSTETSILYAIWYDNYRGQLAIYNNSKGGLK